MRIKGVLKVGESDEGRPMHYSVGAVIERDFGDLKKYLLVDRLKMPLGFAGPAGHIDEGETPMEALVREVYEETNTRVWGAGLIYDDDVENVCSRGFRVHYWYLYYCKVEGEAVHNPEEAKSIGWYSIDEIRQMYENDLLEPVWKQWFERLEFKSSSTFLSS